jgi:hypothetical protein
MSVTATVQHSRPQRETASILDRYKWPLASDDLCDVRDTDHSNVRQLALESNLVRLYKFR